MSATRNGVLKYGDYRFGILDMEREHQCGGPTKWRFNCVELHNLDENEVNQFEVEKVIYNGPATIVFWKDGTKTVVKCDEEDRFSRETGLLMCIAKKAYGNRGKFNDILREYAPPIHKRSLLGSFFLNATD